MKISQRIVLSFSVAVLIGCQKPVPAPSPAPPEVTVALPVRKDVTLYKFFTGRTAAFAQAEIRARVPGFLESIHFSESSDVNQGDQLFVIEQKPYQTALDGATAQLASANAAFQLSETNVARAKELIKSKAITRQELDVIAAEYAQAQAAIKVAEAAVENAKIELDYTQVTSPLSGRVDRWYVDVGNLVGAEDKTLLAKVVQLDTIYAYFDVDEQTLLKALNRNGGSSSRDPDKKIPISLARQTDQDAYPFEGTLSFIDNVIDESTGTILVRGTFPNPDKRLLPGMSVRLRLPIRTQTDATLVQEEAIGTDMQGKYVLVVGKDNLVERRSVRLGALENGQRVIEEGLTAADQYIVEGIQRARPGLPVQSEMQATPQAQASEAPPADARE